MTKTNPLDILHQLHCPMESWPSSNRSFHAMLGLDPRRGIANRDESALISASLLERWARIQMARKPQQGCLAQGLSTQTTMLLCDHYICTGARLLRYFSLYRQFPPTSRCPFSAYCRCGPRRGLHSLKLTGFSRCVNSVMVTECAFDIALILVAKLWTGQGCGMMCGRPNRWVSFISTYITVPFPNSNHLWACQ